MNTYISDKTLKKSFARTGSAVNIIFPLLTAAFCAYLLLHPHISPEAVRNSLNFCLTTLIPSLFPMMVAGEILILSGFGAICAKSVGGAFSRIFGIRGEGAAAFALGCVCGYPVGGKTALSLYGEGKIERSECEFLCALSNNAGPGFVIAGIGGVMWGNVGFGVILYVTELISAVLAGLLLKPLFIKNKPAPPAPDKTKENIPVYDAEKRRSLSEIFSVSVASGVTSILKVCGFVVLFEILLTGIFSMIPDIPGKDLLTCIIAAVSEITSGAVNANTFALSGANSTLIFGRIITFALVSWGGLSAHMQLNAFASEKKLILKKYYLVKAASAAISAVIGCILSILPLLMF